MLKDKKAYQHHNHFRAGLQHKKLQSRSRINHHEQDIADVDRQTIAVEREFQKHADIHGLRYRNVDGFETATYQVESQIESANHYLWGAIGAVIVAIVFGVYFSVTTMVSESFWTLFAASVLVAVLIGILASMILRSAFNASAVNPAAIKKINITLVVSGGAFFIMLALFAWLRFASDSPLADYLPAMMVGIELSALIFAGACDCGCRMYRWSKRLNRKHRDLLNTRAALEDDLAEEELALEEIEDRLHHGEAHRHVENHPDHTHHAHHAHHSQEIVEHSFPTKHAVAPTMHAADGSDHDSHDESDNHDDRTTEPHTSVHHHQDNGDSTAEHAAAHHRRPHHSNQQREVQTNEKQAVYN